MQTVLTRTTEGVRPSRWISAEGCPWSIREGKRRMCEGEERFVAGIGRCQWLTSTVLPPPQISWFAIAAGCPTDVQRQTTRRRSTPCRAFWSPRAAQRQCASDERCSRRKEQITIVQSNVGIDGARPPEQGLLKRENPPKICGSENVQRAEYGVLAQSKTTW